MAECPLCNSPLDVEEEELDEGDVLSCDECGATLTVVNLNPLEIQEDTEELFEGFGEEEFEEDVNTLW